jgi:hypothetical protein
VRNCSWARVAGLKVRTWGESCHVHISYAHALGLLSASGRSSWRSAAASQCRKWRSRLRSAPAPAQLQLLLSPGGQPEGGVTMTPLSGTTSREKERVGTSHGEQQAKQASKHDGQPRFAEPEPCRFRGPVGSHQAGDEVPITPVTPVT